MRDGRIGVKLPTCVDGIVPTFLKLGKQWIDRVSLPTVQGIWIGHFWILGTPPTRLGLLRQMRMCLQKKVSDLVPP